MLPSVMDTRADLDQVLYQSVVDEEFRELVADHPEAFGVSGHSMALPEAVEAQDRALLDLVSGLQFTAQCRSTCSSSVFTIICDGTTK